MQRFIGQDPGIGMVVVTVIIKGGEEELTTNTTATSYSFSVLTTKNYKSNNT